MAYLQPADYPNYGLPASTSADWITAATALINSYCRRPDLNIAEYTERLRITRDAQTVRLSYLPLAPLGDAASSIVSVQGRYARPRRGELVDNPLVDAAWAFSLPGQWTTIDPASIDLDPNTGELTLPQNLFGLALQRVIRDLYSRARSDWRRHQVSLRADRPQRTIHARAQRPRQQNRHHADAVFLEFASGRHGQTVASSLRRDSRGVSL